MLPTVKIGPYTLPNSLVVAPMAGVTDRPFRLLCRRMGAGLAVSEMVIADSSLWHTRKSRLRLDHTGEPEPRSVQIAGGDADMLANAARMNAEHGAQIIDINMGCPAKKVVGGMSGSALMREPDHALRLIEAVVGAVNIPVTLKTRLGWDDDSLNAADLARRAENAGVRRITIHGRTRCQFYKGAADWVAIGAVKRAVSVPVLANGDIVDSGSARMALDQSGADGVMIGRGAQGQPWLLAVIAHDLFGMPEPQIPTGKDYVNMVAQHYENALSFYGADLGARTFRKHLGWYMDQAETNAVTRREMLTLQSPALVLARLSDALLDAKVKAA